MQIWKILNDKFRRRSYALFFLILIGVFAEMLSVGLIVPIFSLLLNPEKIKKYEFIEKYTAVINGQVGGLILSSMIILVFVYLLKGVYLAYLEWKKIQFAFDLQESISLRLFDGYINRPYSYHLKNNSSKLISNITSESNIFVNVAVFPFLTIVVEGAVIIGICSIIIFVEPSGAVITFLLLALIIYFFQLFTRGALWRWGSLRQKHEAERIKQIQQGIGGIKEVKLSEVEPFFISNFRSHNIATSLVKMKHTAMQQMPRLFLEFSGIFGISTLVVFLTLTNKSIDQILPIVALFAAAAFRMMPSGSRLINSIQSLRFSKPTVQLLADELTDIYQAPKLTGLKKLTLVNSIEFKSVYFSYENTTHEVLKNLNLTIEKNKSTSIIGDSGSGKSTLLNLFLGLISPTSGTISVDGKNLENINNEWRRNIGYVPQDVFLIDDTIVKNVAFGIIDADISIEKIITSLKMAQLWDYVSTQPSGLLTILGERGSKLSGGQRQRIGIARALYRDPEVLVFDEATSGLDPVTEAEVMKSIDGLHNIKTILIVTHRVSTTQNCDVVYELKNGQIFPQK